MVDLIRGSLIVTRRLILPHQLYSAKSPDVIQHKIQDTGHRDGDEIGELTDLGYQKIWLTPKGKQLAATAGHLRGMHAFLEDLREGLGITSLYNEGLGSVNEHHLYDRVEARDSRHEKKPWEKALRS